MELAQRLEGLCRW